MKSKEYILAFNKVWKGINEYSFDLNDKFLAEIEGAAIPQANVVAKLQLLKADTVYHLDFHLTGTVQCECDVCLEAFDLPIDAEYKLMLKLGDSENYDDDEIYYITEKMIEFDLSQYLYESLMLAIPTRKVCDMSGVKQCNQEVITKLEELNSEADEEDEHSNPTWDKLKNIFNN